MVVVHRNNRDKTEFILDQNGRDTCPLNVKKKFFANINCDHFDLFIIVSPTGV